MSTLERRRSVLPHPVGAMPLRRDADNVFLLVLGAAAGVAVPLLGLVGVGDLVGVRPRLAAWLCAAATAAALVAFFRRDPEKDLPRWWCALWTVAAVAFAVQLVATSAPVSGAFPPGASERVFGFYAGNAWLAVLWTGAVALAWRWPDVTWPHAVLFAVLAASLLWNTLGSGAPVPFALGLAFAASLGIAGWFRVRELRANLRAADAVATGDRPRGPALSIAQLLRQVWRDANGKEVQIAATYSYMWLADQVGHVGLGLFVGTLLYRCLAYLFPPVAAAAVGFGLVAGGVCCWELVQYRLVTRPHPGPVQADTTLVGRNAVVAALYMVLGVGAGCAFQLPLASMLAVLTALGFVGVVAAKYWVRQKIVWQKAGLPYLSRLSDARHDGLEAAANTLDALIRAAAPPPARPHQVVLAGPLGSGRTRLAAAVGTEFAFRNKSVRYLSLDRLIEFASAEPPPYADDRGPSNIAYWPWTEAQVLIIDDIGPVLGRHDAQRLLDLLRGELRSLQRCLADRHTVWVLGDVGNGREGHGNLTQFAAMIRDFCEGSVAPTEILLQAGGRPPAPPPGSRRQRG